MARGRQTNVGQAEAPNTMNLRVPEGYEALAEILGEAFDQSANGKGRERHSSGQPWTQQPIITITGTVGVGFPLGQAMKKIDESQRMEEPERAVAELLGAIVYLAAAIYNIRTTER